MSMFFNRKNELRDLKQIYDSKKSELVLVYGRRRVGKSRLLLESIKNKNAIYFLADASRNVLDILAEQTKEKFVKFSNWDDFFKYIYESSHRIFIIDEFQYLYKVNKAWPTILQRWWETIRETNKKIILCGSIISTIYKISKGYGSALYGRKTYEFNIKPLNFKFMSKFFDYSVEDLIKTYSFVGGVPRYLEEIDKNKTIEENIKTKFINKISFLYNEPMNLLYEEFRDAAPYISIFLALTQGYVKFNDISVFSKIESNKLPKYLATLERVGLIEKEVPVTEKKIKSKITRYRIMDNFYRFWFKFIFKNKSLIEQNKTDVVFTNIKSNMNSFIGLSFECVCKEMLLDIDLMQFNKIGRWWHKAKEIDIVGLNEDKKEILFCECKWKSNVNPEMILNDLKEKAKYVEWYNENRKEKYAIFAKSFKKKIKEKNVYLYDLRDIGKIINRKV